MEAADARIVNFDPLSDLIHEEDCNTLLLYLPGFRKEQLKVQLTTAGEVRISGSRQLQNDNVSRFQKQFLVAENCDTTKISAKFEDGILYVRQPKIQTPENKTHQEMKQKSSGNKSSVDNNRSSQNKKDDDVTKPELSAPGLKQMQITNALLLIFVFALGIYVAKLAHSDPYLIP